ncbi:hypothetical protein ES708_04564 [subsurface metagenome]
MIEKIVEITTKYTVHLKSGGTVILEYIGPPLFLLENEEEEPEEKVMVRKLMTLCERYAVPIAGV